MSFKAVSRKGEFETEKYGMYELTGQTSQDYVGLRDDLTCCVADSFTSVYGGFVIFSVIGYIANEANMEIDEVATSGPGLGMVVYPETITKLPIPQIWSVLFFLMLLCLGIDSQFGVFETVSSGLTDMFPNLRKRKIMVTAAICVVLLLLDLPYVTNGGIFLYQLVDWYFSAFCVIVISFLECFLIAWVYGSDRYAKDIQMMLHLPPPAILRICWGFITPFILLTTFIIMCYQYEPPTYDGYTYGTGAKVMGNILAIIPLIPLPITMVWEIYKAEGSLTERILFLLKPSADWGPRVLKHRLDYQLAFKEYNVPLKDTVRHNLLGEPKQKSASC